MQRPTQTHKSGSMLSSPLSSSSASTHLHTLLRGVTTSSLGDTITTSRKTRNRKPKSRPHKAFNCQRIQRSQAPAPPSPSSLRRPRIDSLVQFQLRLLNMLSNVTWTAAHDVRSKLLASPSPSPSSPPPSSTPFLSLLPFPAPPSVPSPPAPRKSLGVESIN